MALDERLAWKVQPNACFIWGWQSHWTTSLVDDEYIYIWHLDGTNDG